MVPTRVAEAKAIGGAAKGEQPAVGFYGADEAFEELSNVLFDSEFLRGGEKLYDEIEETLREGGDESLPGCARMGGVRVKMGGMARSGLGRMLLGCNSHGRGGLGGMRSLRKRWFVVELS